MLTLIFYLATITILLWIAVQVTRISILARRAVRYGKQTVPVHKTILAPENQVLVIGDSTAFGTGAILQEHSLVGRLAKDLPHTSIINGAKNAMNLNELKTHLEPHEENAYDYVIVHIGGMDTITLLPLSILRQRARISLESAKRVAKRKVFLVSVCNVGAIPFFQYPLNRYFEARSSEISTIFDSLCMELEIEHIPLYQDKKFDPLYKDRHRYFAPDGLHPNDEGYGLWYEKIKPIVVSNIVKNHD
jgi:lysophospholipase L1-like esterase